MLHSPRNRVLAAMLLTGLNRIFNEPVPGERLDEQIRLTESLALRAFFLRRKRKNA
jgi:hypothetical protein